MSDKSKSSGSSNPKSRKDPPNRNLKTEASEDESVTMSSKKSEKVSPPRETRKPVTPLEDLPSTSTKSDSERPFREQTPDLSTRDINSETRWPLEMSPFRAKHSTRRINFLEPMVSLPSSEESVVTVIEASRMYSYKLRSTSSKSSVSILPSSHSWENQVNYLTKVFKLGCWEVAYEVDSKKSDSYVESFKGLMSTRICKILMCFLFGIVLPSILFLSGHLSRDILNDSRF